MFAKDFNILNRIYNKDILLKENVGLGPKVDGSPFSPYEAGGSAPVRRCDKCSEDDECNCNNTEEDELIFAKKPGSLHLKSKDSETNAYMAKQQLFRIVKMASMLHDLVSDDEELKAWMAAKITQAFDDLNSIFGYKDYENFRKQIDADMEIEEGTEKDLYDSISKGGGDLLKTIKGAIRNESRENIEKVLYEVINTLEDKK